MPINSQPSQDDDLTTQIDRLVREELLAEQERRSAHRTSLVRPVLVQLSDEEYFFGISKNISAIGLGLIMRESLPTGTIASLSIHCLTGDPLVMRGELRWVGPFGAKWFATGWNFIGEVRR